MGEGQNVPESKGGFLHPQNCNFPEESFILSSPCNSVGLHCKDKMPKILNKYSKKWNIGASVSISTFMCLWANYIFPRWVCLFCWRKYVDRSWEYINRSQTHKCGNWDWGSAIPRKGIYKRNCRCSVDHQCFTINYPRLFLQSTKMGNIIWWQGVPFLHI